MARRTGFALRGVAVAALVVWLTVTAAHAQRPVLAAAIGVAAALPLLVQPRAPLACLAAAVAGLALSDALAGRALEDDPYIVMLLWCCFGVGRWSSPRRQGVAVAFVVLFTISAVTVAGEQDLPADLVFPVLFTGAPLVLGRMRQRSEDQVRRLREQAAQLELGRELELHAAAQEERLRIARDLHDVVAHGISAVSLQAQVLRRRAEAGAPLHGDDLLPVEHCAQEAMRELRAMLGVLRPGPPDADLAPSAGVDDLPALVERTRAAGQEVALRETGRPVPLQAGLSLTVHRLVQEALTNARRHGGPGATDVSLDWHEDALTVRVRSPLPERVAVTPGGHGLTGMRERTAAYDGRLAVGPDGDAWVVEAHLPVQRRVG